jgi:hypothetical protein
MMEAVMAVGFSVYLLGILKTMGTLKEQHYPDRSPKFGEVMATAVVCLIWPIAAAIALLDVAFGGQDG